MNTFVTFRVIFLAAVLALAFGPLAYWLTRRLGLVDIPGSAPHKLHDHHMPVAGGMVIFISLVIVSLLERTLQSDTVRAILIAGTLVFLFGLLDDRVGLSPLWKMVGQLLATLVLIRLGVHVRLFYQDWLNYALTIFWMIGVTNAYNFVDSMDGLAVGLAGMASAFFMLVTIDSQQNDLSLFATMLVGACFGTFYFNTSPAKYFLGDSGSQFLGFILGALGIAYNPLGFTRLASWYVPILLVGVPIFDTTLVVISRLRRGRPVYQAARDHTFHRLVAIGLSSNRAVLTMHTSALLLGCLAFIALATPPLVANLIFGTIVFIAAGLIFFLEGNQSVRQALQNG